MGRMWKKIWFYISVYALVTCQPRHEDNSYARFKNLSPVHTKIQFINQLDYTEQLNTYTFKNFYNGGGVGIGDINNDGLADIFLAGNLVANKLYLNKGNLIFEDITDKAGVDALDSWTTGVTMVDINGDGFLDIYICKSGPPDGSNRANQLFINNGDLTFTDRAAEYGLDYLGLSTHAAFFDYDRDGDLDCYLLNNSIRSVGGYDLREDQRKIPDPKGGNKLLRNDNGRFVEVSQDAGIYTSEIGFGLGVTIGDINNDNWPDIYIANDFFEKDYLYINNRDGTFREALEEYLREISLGSMGADMADVNNDGLPEIFVTEMLPHSDERLKTTIQFENWDKYQLNVSKGYYHQFSRNVLQLNNGDGSFSEIARLADVHATDWSWGALIFDMDNDGWKDIFVANGIYKDLLNQDYVNFVSSPGVVREILKREGNVIKRLVDSIPSNKVPNYAFKNTNGIQFHNITNEWGLGQPTYSNGSAYGDLDNDGDLDLVLNNVNMPALVYENRSSQLSTQNSWLSFSLKGEGLNSLAIGTKITLIAKGQRQFQELSPARGFMSSVDYRLFFGLGANKIVDSVVIDWPDDRRSVLTNVPVNQIVEVNQSEAGEVILPVNTKRVNPVFSRIVIPGGKFKHQENEFVDFDRDRLLFHMISNEGPCACKGDINNDGLEDFYIGGAKNHPGALFVQTSSGKFVRLLSSDVLKADKDSEDTACIFFDANGDGFMDLYVASGGYEFSPSSTALIDRLYFNSGNGSFTKGKQLLPIAEKFVSSSVVAAHDYDGDGDLDLFVGGRVIPFLYGVPSDGFILNNDGKGNFTNITPQVAKGLLNIGMIRDAAWTDVNGDNKADLVIVGDWMPVSIFIYIDGQFENKSDQWGMHGTSGWYNTVTIADVNHDGKPDIIAGNHGLNSRFKASVDEPIRLYVNDFDQNGSVEQILTRFEEGKQYPFVLRQDLVMQIPALKKKLLRFNDYKGRTMEDIFTQEELSRSLVLEAKNLETSLWLNTGNTFERVLLPIEAQFSPVYAIAVDDFDHDGYVDILLGGNLYRSKPEVGIYDASYGLMLKGRGTGEFKAVRSYESGLHIKGEIRSFLQLRYQRKNSVLVAKNNDQIEFFTY